MDRSTSVRTPAGKGPTACGPVWMEEALPDPSVGQLPHHRGSIRTGRELRHELLDLSPRPVDGALEESLPVLQGEVRPELRDGRQVQPPVGQHGQEVGMLSRGAGGGDAEVGLGLGEVEDLGAVREHRCARLSLGKGEDDVAIPKPYSGDPAGESPARQRLATSRKRVLRGRGATHPRSVDSESEGRAIEPRKCDAGAVAVSVAEAASRRRWA